MHKINAFDVFILDNTEASSLLDKIQNKKYVALFWIDPEEYGGDTCFVVKGTNNVGKAKDAVTKWMIKIAKENNEDTSEAQIRRCIKMHPRK